MSEVFIVHEKFDGDLALEIALALERACFSTWCYEIDSLPGVSYLNQTRGAIDRATAVVVVISPNSLGSPQVTRELVRAFEKAKPFIPVLRQMTHLDLQERQPEWADILGAATTVRVPAGGAAGIVPRMLDGLRALGIKPTAAPVQTRIQRIEEMIGETPPPPIPPDPERSFGPDLDPDRPPPPRPRLLARVGSLLGIRAGVALLASAILIAVVALAMRGGKPGDDEGGVLNSIFGRSSMTVAPPTQATPKPAIPESDGPIVLGVMDIRALGEVPEWMLDFTRDGLNTVLSKAPAKVRVYSRQKIDLVRKNRQLSEIEAAEHLGIAKMISGTITIRKGRATLEVQIVDISSGLLEDSERVEGLEDELIQMQNRAVEKMVKALKVSLNSEDRNRMFSRDDDALDSYKLLTETMGEPTLEGDKPADTPPGKHSGLGLWQREAWAGEDDEAAVRAVLERYRAALEAKDLEQLAAVQDVNDTQLQALSKYFANANGLKVKFTDFDILFEGDEAVATFTRDDVFEDVPTGRDRHLEVRVSSVLGKHPERGWRIRGFKKPS